MKFIKDKFKNKLNFYDEILVLEQKNVITSKVANFYKKTPFPNYNEFDTIQDLLNTLKSNKLINDLKKYIGFNKRIIEVGSGTCQLSIALASGTNNSIVSLDPTLEALKLGSNFAEKNNIKNIKFLNADLFDDPIKESFFDLVWCSGVLHHTQNTQKGLKIILKWLKPKGLIIIGLYNKYGRMRTFARQILYKVFMKSIFGKNIIYFLDPYLRKNLSQEKKEAWFKDQYDHPVERSHSMDEVLKWFDENNIDFIGSVPSIELNDGYTSIQNMNCFKGTFITRIILQLSMIFSKNGSEGGLFIMIGKKN